MIKVMTVSNEPGASNNSLKIQVYNILRTYLMKGRFKPGERIVIERLAKELGTSPTPVREALLMLVQENALEMKASSSCRVPDISARRYIEIRDIRIALQGLAVREAMKHVDLEKTARLMEAAHENFMKAQKAGELEEMLEHNEEFNMILIQQCKMPVLISMVESLWMQVGPVINLVFQHNTPTFIGPHPHRVMIAGVKRGSPDTVCQAINDLLMESGDFIINLLEERGLMTA